MATKLRPLAQHCKRLLPLLAAPAALLLIQGQAKALLTYNIFESGSNVVVETSGSLDLTGAILNSDQICVDGAIQSIFALLCTGTSVFTPTYNIMGPTLFDGTVNIFPASNVSGTSTILVGEPIFGGVGVFGIDSAYTSNTPIVSSATFNGETLASLGFTTTGLIGTWTIYGTSESIQVVLGAPAPPATAVPGPLPLFGAAAAFGWSRRLRKRIATPLSTPPQG